MGAWQDAQQWSEVQSGRCGLDSRAAGAYLVFNEKSDSFRKHSKATRKNASLQIVSAMPIDATTYTIKCGDSEMSCVVTVEYDENEPLRVSSI